MDLYPREPEDNSERVETFRPKIAFYVVKLSCFWLTRYTLNVYFNVLHIPCNYITCVKFNTDLWHKAFYLLINAATCFDLNRWPNSVSSYIFFDMCRLWFALSCKNSTYVYKYTIIKCSNSQYQLLPFTSICMYSGASW